MSELEPNVSVMDVSKPLSSSARRTAEDYPVVARTKIWLVLPAFNEEASLPPLFDAIQQAMADHQLPYEVVIVDDGSKDQTGEIITKRSFQMPIRLKVHPVNLGLGPTIRDGLKMAAELCSPHDILVTMDADNTHPPGLIRRMVREIQEGYDVVIASRFRTGARIVGVPFARHFLSTGARALFTVLFPTKGVRDYTSGFRAYRGSVMKQAFATYGDKFVGEAGFSCMCDILLKLRKQGALFYEVPLVLRYDQKGGVTKMQVMRTIWRTLALLFRRRFGQL